RGREPVSAGGARQVTGAARALSAAGGRVFGATAIVPQPAGRSRRGHFTVVQRRRLCPTNRRENGWGHSDVVQRRRSLPTSRSALAGVVSTSRAVSTAATKV